MKGKGSIFRRFRNVSLAIFALAILVMLIALVMAFNHIIMTISIAYAKNIAISSANALSEHISNEIHCIANAANSTALKGWLADEGNDEKKAAAYRELAGIVGELYSNNLYLSFYDTLHEYKIIDNLDTDDLTPFVTLDAGNPYDAWFFDCIASDEKYSLGVSTDYEMNKKRVFLDYKVFDDGAVLGILSTGMDFEQLTGELFSQFDTENMHGFIIDEFGNINMDSMRIYNPASISGVVDASIYNEITTPVFRETMSAYLGRLNDGGQSQIEPEIVKLSPNLYKYATIAPIAHTRWSAVILFNSASSLDMILFLPVFAAMIALLVLFTLVVSAISYKFIFKPLDLLIDSIERLHENGREKLYGIDRTDEIGSLSNTILDLFTKTNYDALTGIFNRRYLENHLNYLNEFISRSNGFLSVFLIDVDYFKRYNDTYGHDQGDICLRMIAGALSESIQRANDFIARYGGEEFVAILPGTDKAGAHVMAERMLKKVKALGLPHSNSDVADCVTISVGITTGKASYTENCINFIKRADEALYLSKQNGRDRFTYLDFKEAAAEKTAAPNKRSG